MVLEGTYIDTIDVAKFRQIKSTIHRGWMPDGHTSSYSSSFNTYVHGGFDSKLSTLKTVIKFPGNPAAKIGLSFRFWAFDSFRSDDFSLKVTKGEVSTVSDFDKQHSFHFVLFAYLLGQSKFNRFRGFQF